MGIILFLIGGVLYFWPKDVVQSAITWSGPTNVIGTRVGTTTTGVWIANFTSTTSAVTKITSMADMAVFTLKITKASTTAGSNPGVRLTFLGSYDSQCDTTATSTTDAAYHRAKPLVEDINWFDIGSHAAELAGTQTIYAATSTFSLITPKTGHGQDITLVNLNYECIKTEVAASSTELMIQVKSKGQY